MGFLLIGVTIGFITGRLNKFAIHVTGHFKYRYSTLQGALIYTLLYMFITIQIQYIYRQITVQIHYRAPYTYVTLHFAYTY